MGTTVKCAMHFLCSAVVAGCGISAVMPEATSEEAGWTTLFDGKDLDGWDQVGGSNWHVADGAIVADTMADKKEAGYLVTKKSYKNFAVLVEFMPSDDANSGIYFR